MSKSDLITNIAGALGLVALHVLVFPLFTGIATNVVLFCVDLFALYNGLAYSRVFSYSRVTLYVAGYLVLFIFLFVLVRSPLLFATFGMLYAALYAYPVLLGYLLILVLSITIITPYWFQTTLLAGALYTIAAPMTSGSRQCRTNVYKLRVVWYDTDIAAGPPAGKTADPPVFSAGGT